MNFKTLLVLLAPLCAATAVNAQSFSNSHDSTIYSFGANATPTYGEVFTLGSAKTLADWSFYADAGNAGNLELVVAKWNGTQAVGPALYTSLGSYAGGAQALTFNNINTLLGAGSYISFLTVNGVAGGATSMGLAGSSSNGGLGGSFQYEYSGGSPLASNSWTGYSVSNMQYKADFVAAVPEPETYALMLGGLGIMGFVARRRKPV